MVSQFSSESCVCVCLSVSVSLSVLLRTTTTVTRRFFQRMELKTMYGKNLVGKNLATLARVYVDSMNEGTTPTIATAWTRVVEAQCEEAVEKALAE